MAKDVKRPPGMIIALQAFHSLGKTTSSPKLKGLANSSFLSSKSATLIGNSEKYHKSLILIF